MAAPRRKKTAEELQSAMEAAQKKLADLKRQSYETELAAAVNASNIVREFNAIKDKFKDVDAVMILQAVGKAARVPRVVVTQSEPVKRSKKKG